MIHIPFRPVSNHFIIQHSMFDIRYSQRISNNEYRMVKVETRGASFLRATLLATFLLAMTTPAFSQIGGKAGAYSRLGFGARGMGMGNALTAVTSGDAIGYYNPATLPFAEYRNISASFGILSFDRRLNFLSFAQPLSERAGISAGIINSGVSNIDGRDSDGEPTGPLKTSENQVFLGFGTQFKNGLAIGLNVKYLYHHLYTDVNSSTFGIDFGALFPVNNSITIGATMRDLVSKYSWNIKTGNGLSSQTEDKFPQLYTFGVACKLPDSLGIAAVDAEFSNQSTINLKVGVEVPIIPEVSVRAGMDRIDVKEKGNGVRPTFGFTARKSFEEWTPAINYAFVIEPFATSGMHMISLSVIF
jgi:hypothetical protein